MTQIKKFAWYGSSVAFAALLAVTLLVTSTTQSVFAAGTLATTVAVGGNVTLAVDDTDLGGEDLSFVQVEIIGGAGIAEIHAASGTKQQIVVVDNGAGDTNAAASAVSIRINGVSEGSVIVRVTEFGNAGAEVTYNLPLEVTSAASNFEVDAVDATIPADGGDTDITATLLDGNGDAVNGTTVTFVTNLGNFAGANQVDQAATAGAGEATVTLEGGGVAGVATVTATAPGGFSATVQVTFSGDAANMIAVPVKSSILAGTTLNVTDLTVTVTDTAGNPVAGETVSFDEQTPTTNGVTVDDTADGTAATVIPDCTAGTNASGKCNASVTAAAATAKGTHTLTFELDSDTDVTATAEVNVAGAAAAMAVNAPGIEPVSVGEITVTVLDASGNPVADGTNVLLVVTAGAIVDNEVATDDGVATFTYVSPGTAQSVNATAIVGSLSASDTFNVGVGAGEPEPGDGSFSGTIAPSGVSLVTFDGGSLADFQAAAMGAAAVSVWSTVDGSFIGYIPGAPAVVNAAFNAHFADGVAAGTIVIIVR